MKEVQAAAHCVTEAADNNGPMMFARMGMMPAINRHKHRNSIRNANPALGNTKAQEG
jgi:hypothetical protein